jgi:hypothetical protein
LATGDQHPLLTAIADHSIALLEVIRDIVNDIDRSAKPTPEPPPDGPPGGGPGAPAHTEDAPSRTRYQSIPVTLEE